MTERHISDVEVGLKVYGETPSSQNFGFYCEESKNKPQCLHSLQFLTNVKFPSIIANGFATYSPGHFQNTLF